jgi:hypothetical protein
MLDRILRWLIPKRRAPSRKKGEQALLNYALDLAQEWGGDWLKPVQERLRKAYPEMTQDELDRLNSIAQAAMKAGHELVYSMAEQRSRPPFFHRNVLRLERRSDLNHEGNFRGTDRQKTTSRRSLNRRVSHCFISNVSSGTAYLNFWSNVGNSNPGNLTSSNERRFPSALTTRTSFVSRGNGR